MVVVVLVILALLVAGLVVAWAHNKDSDSTSDTSDTK